VSGNPAGRPPRRESRTDSAGPRAARETRVDGIANPFTGTGTSRDRRTATYHYTRVVSDYEARDLRRGNWLAKRIIEMPPADAYRKGYELKLGDKKRSEQVQSVLETLGINKKLVDAAQKEREAGGAALLPILEGSVGSMATPLDLTRHSPRRIKTIHLLEPRELQPVSWYTRLGDEKFRRPEVYAYHPINGAGLVSTGMQYIHESRMAIFPGVKISPETLHGQRTSWGDNVLTPVQEVINDFGLSWGSAAAIVHDFSQGTWTIDDLDDMLKEEGGWQAVEKRVRRQDMFRSSLRTLILSAKEKFERKSSSVAGLAELLIQFMTLTSAAADMSVVRLFGISPAGLNATGQSDIELTDDRTITHQANYIEPTEQLIEIALSCVDGPTRGVVPEVWSAEWRPLRTPTAKEEAERRKTVAETDEKYVAMDPSLTDSIIESRFKGDTYSAETVVNWTERAKQKKIEEERAEEIAADPAAMLALRPGAPNPEDDPNPDDDDDDDDAEKAPPKDADPDADEN
jgi:phage-related protein (TIGR01555 family)